MGLFGGSKKSVSSQATTVNTTTNTTIRDIGLTGQGAVDLASVMVAGQVARDEINRDLLLNISQQSSGNFARLASGANLAIDRAAQATSMAGVQQAGFSKVAMLALAAGAALLLFSGKFARG